MTQPAVSHQITELEHEIGAKLFQRSSHHVALTAEGEEFTQKDDMLSKKFGGERGEK